MTSNQIAYQKNIAEQDLERSSQAIKARDVATKEAELPSKIFGNWTKGASNIADTVATGTDALKSITRALDPSAILMDRLQQGASLFKDVTAGAGNMVKGIGDIGGKVASILKFI